MPKPTQIQELKDWDGNPLDLSKADVRQNDMDEEYPSEPPTFEIPDIAKLQEWDEAGRPVPAGSHNSGSHTNRSYG